MKELFEQNLRIAIGDLVIQAVMANAQRDSLAAELKALKGVKDIEPDLFSAANGGSNGHIRQPVR